MRLPDGRFVRNPHGQASLRMGQYREALELRHNVLRAIKNGAHLLVGLICI